MSDDPAWYNKPEVLIKKWKEIYPINIDKLLPNQKYNSVIRLLIIIFLIIIIFSTKNRLLIFISFVIIILLSVLFWSNKEKLFKTEKFKHNIGREHVDEIFKKEDIPIVKRDDLYRDLTDSKFSYLLDDYPIQKSIGEKILSRTSDTVHPPKPGVPKPYAQLYSIRDTDYVKRKLFDTLPQSGHYQTLERLGSIRGHTDPIPGIRRVLWH